MGNNSGERPADRVIRPSPGFSITVWPGRLELQSLGGKAIDRRGLEVIRTFADGWHRTIEDAAEAATGDPSDDEFLDVARGLLIWGGLRGSRQRGDRRPTTHHGHRGHERRARPRRCPRPVGVTAVDPAAPRVVRDRRPRRRGVGRPVARRGAGPPPARERWARHGGVATRRCPRRRRPPTTGRRRAPLRAAGPGPPDGHRRPHDPPRARGRAQRRRAQRRRRVRRGRRPGRPP